MAEYTGAHGDASAHVFPPLRPVAIVFGGD